MVWDSDTAVSGLEMPVGARGWGGVSSAGRWTSRCLPPAAVRLGSTWWNGVVLSELVRPNEELERRVAEVGAAWVARGGTFRVGMHVRGGHKYIEMPPAPAAKYVWQLRRLVAALFRLPFLEPVDERHEYTRARDRVLEWEGDGERGSAAGRGGRGERCRVHHVGVQGVQGGDNGRDGEVEFKGGPSEGGGVGVHGVGAFVATEDNDALEEIQRGAAEGGVHVMVVDEEHRRPNLRISVPMAVLHDVYVIYTHKHTPRKQELRARALSLSLCIFISICTHTHTHTHAHKHTHTHTDKSGASRGAQRKLGVAHLALCSSSLFRRVPRCVPRCSWVFLGVLGVPRCLSLHSFVLARYSDVLLGTHTRTHARTRTHTPQSLFELVNLTCS